MTRPISPHSSPIDGEDEIGGALGQELQLRLAAVEIALAEHAAGADRDLRLDDVIAAAERIALRVEERQHALPLIVVQQELPRAVRDRHEQADDGRGCSAAAGRRAGSPCRRRLRPAAPCRGPAARRSAASARRCRAPTTASELKLGGSGRSCRNHAHASGTASFMISEGWKRTTPRSSQRCAPIAMSPMNMTASSSTSPMTVRPRRDRCESGAAESAPA